MGIQINGQTDTISAVDGGLAVSGYELTGPSNINVTGIITATTLNATNIKHPSFGSDTFVLDNSGNINIDSGGVYYDATNNRFAIGTTSPGTTLHVYGSDATLTNIQSTAASTYLLMGNSNNNLGYIGYEGTKFNFYPNNTANALVVTPTGVGIGIASPSKTLHVYSSSFTFPARIETNGTGSGIELKDGTTGANPPTVGAIGDSFYVTTNNAERMRITNGGYFKAADNGTYRSSSATYHEINQSQNNNTIYVRAASTSFSSTILVADAVRAATSGYWFFLGTSGDGADLEFRVTGDGNAFCDGSFTGGGADYAEYFEWSDSNQSEEDRRGISVVLDGDKIREAVAGEDPIGVISGNPSVVGDAAWNKWNGKHLRDEFGSYLLDAEGYRQLNPDYDPDVEYVSREDRPEWGCVGLMGKLRIRKGQVTGARWIKMCDISDNVEEWLVR